MDTTLGCVGGDNGQCLKIIMDEFYNNMILPFLILSFLFIVWYFVLMIFLLLFILYKISIITLLSVSMDYAYMFFG